MAKKILIVEDEKSISNALKIKLENAGYEVSQAFDGQAGLEVALKEKPDLILLDIIMPVLDGMSMLEQLREDNWGSKVPVVILTNLSDSNKVQDAASQKVYDFLVKADWQISDVLKVVKHYLEK